MVHNSTSEESYVVNRYRLWESWQPKRYGYKHLKGERIAQIIEDTGGIPPVAIELGVGPGGVAAALSKHATRVIGIDLSPDALIRAKEHCQGLSVSLMRGSGFSLPFKDSSLPLVYASQVLHLFDSPGRLALMTEAFRVLAPGGRFVFDLKNVSSHPLRYLRSSPQRRQRNFPADAEIQQLLVQAGYQGVTTMPGVLPLVKWTSVPNNGVFRSLAHTTFFVATRPA